MPRIIKDNYILLLVSMLIGLLAWLSEETISTKVKLNEMEHRLDKIVNEVLIIKDNYVTRRKGLQ